ncbi:type II toxin-antitoxin system prevent-host-death family antitoxin [Crocosphaera sp. UHCC 0190]|nr:type II toxin-antitoxin system prevent-host-death family antitoxin [Crocosphaera sp. XPORK-15E]MEA5510618.1 type II toxin-antitoxin system prevent-host-death family antitoxin [Crocosphaera sp. UHCC 0190]MEA5535396.1 type II toxin-antitoxin system prevent-host-death family antitoxin [Crocosphaera sp. XPORK-15E]
MQKLYLKEANNQLEELIKKASQGEEVIIISDDGECFQILPLKSKKPRPKFGSAKGLIEMSDDFDEPLTDFENYEP